MRQYDPRTIAPQQDLLGLMHIDEAMALFAYACKAQGSIIEIGSYTGYSSLFLAFGIRNRTPSNQRGSAVYCIDTFSRPHPAHAAALQARTVFSFFMEHCKRYGIWNCIHPIMQPAEVACTSWQNGTCGMVCIDGDHLAAKRDFLNWRPHMNPGAFVCFHDYSSAFPQVVADVDALISEGYIEHIETVQTLCICRLKNPINKPRILLLADKPGWALHTVAKAIQQYTADTMDCDILFSSERPQFDGSTYDLLHVLFWEDVYYRPFVSTQCKIVKSVYSHRWELRGMTPMQLYEGYLREAHAITVPSCILQQTLSPLPLNVYLCSEGVDTSRFTPAKTKRSGDLVVGWAGNVKDAIKRVDWLQSACDGLCTLRIAGGDLSEQEMISFYRSIDVIACSSIAEGCPRPLLEGMACGAFPVAFDVGVAREVIRPENGLLVEEASIPALRSAIEWCKEHTDTVRSAQQVPRSWEHVLTPLQQLYGSLLYNTRAACCAL